MDGDETGAGMAKKVADVLTSAERSAVEANQDFGEERQKRKCVSSQHHDVYEYQRYIHNQSVLSRGFFCF